MISIKNQKNKVLNSTCLNQIITINISFIYILFKKLNKNQTNINVFIKYITTLCYKTLMNIQYVLHIFANQCINELKNVN